MPNRRDVASLGHHWTCIRSAPLRSEEDGTDGANRTRQLGEGGGSYWGR
jgi:hypothetical protein